MEFVLNRNYALRSTTGHMLNFEKGVPTTVPPILYKEAIAIGAEPVDGKVDVLGPEEKPEVPLTPHERAEKMIAAFKRMEERNERGDFNAQGLPNTKVLEKLTGLNEISSQERNEVWQAFREERAA